MDTIRVQYRAGAGRVFVRALVAGTIGGALLGALTWTALGLFQGTSALVFVEGSVFAGLIGGLAGVPVAVVVGGALALGQGLSRDGLDRVQGRVLAGLSAGLPVLLVLGAMNLATPRFLVGVVLPLALATAAIAAAVAPPLVRPTVRTVSARPTDAAAAAGTASPGWSRVPGR